MNCQLSPVSTLCTLGKHSLNMTPVKIKKNKTKALTRKATNRVLSHLRMEAWSTVKVYAKYTQNSYV